jgi:hypothetical protein
METVGKKWKGILAKRKRFTKMYGINNVTKRRRTQK